MRELRQHASRWLRRVAEGECYEITVRGVPMARLSPLAPSVSTLERLVAEGLASLPTEGLPEVLERLGPPLPGPPVSDRLAALRRDER